MQSDQKGLQATNGHELRSTKLDNHTADENLSAKRSPQTTRKRRRRWIIIAVIAFIIVAAAIGGGVGGGLSARSKNSSTPTSCNNTGMQFAIYNSMPFSDTDAKFTSFDPTYFKTQKPFYNGTTTNIGLSVPSPPQDIRISGSPLFSSGSFAVDYRTYLYVQEGGVYTFTTTRADDILYFWMFSKNAYTGYSNSSYDFRITSQESGRTVKPSIAKGQYIPMRVVYANAGGAAEFDFSITAPNGDVILNSTSSSSPYLVQYSCDGTSAPAFQDWGQET